MTPRAQALNARLAKASAAAHSALSPHGLGAFYPQDIPFQASQARDAEHNATIGQITDGKGGILSVSAIAGAVQLPDTIANRALLYSPIGGHADLRAVWNEYQTPAAARTTGSAGALPCGPPLVTVGLTHAISLVADLFGGPDRDVIIPDPCWGNYVQVFGIRTGSRIHRASSYVDGSWRWRGLRETLEGLEGDAPAVVVLNLPSNPGGYSPTDEQRVELVDLLVAAAERRPIVVLCDDAYAGLVFDDSISSESMFWDLLDQHEALIPLRGAGSTKEFLLFGGRVGLLTLPFAEGSEAFTVLEDKLYSMIRSSVGSPVSLSQMILLQALQEGSTQAEIALVRERLAARYQTMRAALAKAPGVGTRFRVMPCNSGAFMLLEIADDLDPEVVRQRLLEEFSTGVVSIRPNYLRLAFCSVARSSIEELVARVAAALSPVAEPG